MWALVVTVVLLGATYGDRSPRWARPQVERSGVPDRVYFRGQNEHVQVPVKTRKEIPLELIMEINNAHDVTDFLTYYVDSESYKNVTGTDILSNRFGEDDVRKAVEQAKPATCMPELTIVPLSGSNDSSLFYYPSCTRVERCGGCCSHNLLSCQPTLTEMVNFQVYVTEYTGSSQMKLKGKEIIAVERHTKCKCDCTIKEEDCNRLQEYRKNECRCICLNIDEEKKCNAENDTKLWDPRTCSCGCRETKECSTGYFFDQNICSCAQTPNRIRSALQTRRRRGQKPA